MYWTAPARRTAAMRISPRGCKSAGAIPCIAIPCSKYGMGASCIEAAPDAAPVRVEGEKHDPKTIHYFEERSHLTY
jgi:hypothetical protein